MSASMNFLTSPLFLVNFPIILALFLIRYSWTKHKSKKKLPPGQMGLPWIGETLDFYKAQRKNQLYEDFVEPRIRKYGKTFKTRLMGYPTVVVNGAEANRFLLTNEFKLVISSWPASSVQLMGTNSIMEKQGEKHHFLHGIVVKSLNSSGLESLVPKICRMIKIHFEKYWDGGKETISLYNLTKVLTFSIVLKCFLGIEVKPGTLEIFERVLEGVFAAPVNIPGSKFSRAKKARKDIEKMLVDVIRKKRFEMELEGGRGAAEEEDNLLSGLVTELIHGGISESEVLDNIVLLVFAAHDTTSFAIAMTFRMLALHPTCYSCLLKGIF